MVTILKQPDDGWHYEWECTAKGCQAHLRATVDDVRVGSFDGSYCEKGEEGFYVTCPVCETMHRMKTTEVPPKAQSLARSRNLSWD